MAYVKNQSGQQIVFAVINKTTGEWISGDALNLNGVYSIDGAAAGLMGNVAVEIDSLAMPGVYKMALRQLETNGDVCFFRIYSSTTDAVIDPVTIYPVEYSDYKTGVQDIVDGVWDELSSAHSTPGTTGQVLQEILPISLLVPQIASDTQTIQQVGGAGPWTTGTGATVIDIVNGVWGATATSYNTAGTMGRSMNRIIPIETATGTIIATGGAGPWTTGGGSSAPTESDIYNYFTSSNRQDTFRADVSGLATSLSVGIVDGKCSAILTTVGDIESTGGAGPWTTANVDLSSVALQSTLVSGIASITSTGGAGPWTTANVDLSNVALQATLVGGIQDIITTGGAGPWTTGGGGGGAGGSAFVISANIATGEDQTLTARIVTDN